MDYYTYDFNPPAPPPRAPREPRILGKLVLSAVLGASLALGAFFGIESFAGSEAPAALADPVPAVEAIPAISVMAEEYSPSAVGEAVIPAVVTVEIGRQTSGGLVAQGSGSGVIIDSTGYIVTNDHVAGDADSLRVVLADGRIYEATLIGTDPVTDLAVLDIDADDLTAVEFGSTDEMVVGDTTIAVGSPLGLKGGPSLTVGVLSAVGREVQTSSTSILYGMLQTDAPITQGSSASRHSR